MSINSTGLYGSATIVNSDLFTDVETLKEQVTTLSTTYLCLNWFNFTRILGNVEMVLRKCRTWQYCG